MSLEIVTVTPENIDTEHICCAIGNDKANQARDNQKKEWLKTGMQNGLVFKKFNERGKFFIEYIPAEFAWKPVTAPGYMMIHCLWVSGKYKKQGLGKQLLEECIKDAKAQEKNGVVVVSSNPKKPFLTDKKFFIKNSFETCDTAPPYFELLVNKFNDSPDPHFNNCAKNLITPHKTGLSFMYTHQCPFVDDWVNLLIEFAQENGIQSHKIFLDSIEKAQTKPSAFGTFNLFYNGEFLTHVIPTTKDLLKLLEKQ